MVLFDSEKSDGCWCIVITSLTVVGTGQRVERMDGRTDGWPFRGSTLPRMDGTGRLVSCLCSILKHIGTFSEFSIGTRTEQDMILLVFMELDE